MKTSLLQDEVIGWGILGVVGVVGFYVVIKYVLPGLIKTTTSAAANAANAAIGPNGGLGNNDLTNQSTDFSGSAVNYSGHGVVSSLGATANDLSGGTFASLGESIGGWFAGLDTNYTPYQYSNGRLSAVQDQNGNVYKVDASKNILDSNGNVIGTYTGG